MNLSICQLSTGIHSYIDHTLRYDIKYLLTENFQLDVYLTEIQRVTGPSLWIRCNRLLSLHDQVNHGRLIPWILHQVWGMATIMTMPMIVENGVILLHDNRWTKLLLTVVVNADTHHSSNTTRPHNLLCYRCGKKHGHVCKLCVYPDVKWYDTIPGS